MIVVQLEILSELCKILEKFFYQKADDPYHPDPYGWFPSVHNGWFSWMFIPQFR